ncbi:DUF3352 domain-containing protein [Aetokthonos hydrillicola Thurmond2011]|jgi:hypothetical protein|uniref:DUF3352 domain-containing protein n=1 Tax=Aetokthonos hydrillicola Thurmond2011 TaxID=2712845 RepID=A0AAP5MCF4_9CYAN|nr:DUF3352 domain-containing protein [Aetokthonos hydrillicola]MBO3461297.1 DUF3352 domain-containing protein [Aetokthonos hydrillicola CCALA 1050]MBW4589635.1 DUF3352 domain-containing protein [Aetokthonos hydrillicola CCALA 1050]MDR9899132.1 DUF3352 domain-containing protein [Aetokthonos hydrillicola Thurmond2011]
MKQRSFLSVLIVSIVVLLLVGITACNKSQLGVLSSVATTGKPSTAMFVLKQSPAMVSMLVNPDRLVEQEGNGYLSKIKTGLLADTGIDYQKDIQPWLGNEITLAVTSLDIDHQPENGKQPGYLMVVTTNQSKKSREFVDSFFSKRELAGAKLSVENYKGVKLIDDNNHLVGTAVDDRFVLFANNLKVLREAINNVQATDLNLASSSQYQQAIKELPKSPVAIAFLNLPRVAEWQGLQLKDKTYDSQILSVVLNPKGLLTETTFIAKDETLPPAKQLSKPVGALQYIPASAGLAISGSDLSTLGQDNLSQLWKQANAVISGSQEDTKLPKPLADIQEHLGIDWKEDVLNWVTGEYAIGLLPHQEQKTPDWVFVVEKSEATSPGIARWDKIASSHGLLLNSFTLGEQQIAGWTKLTTKPASTKDQQAFTIQAKVYGTHTSQGNYEIITNSIEAMNQVLNLKGDSLIDNPNFQASTAAMPQPNQGYIYLDWRKIQRTVESQIPVLKLAKIVAKPFFENLRSLTISSYGNDTQLLKGGVFFQLSDP